jgi:ferric-dicitrate binding protein FerR (iron transport regulator)
MVMGEPELQSEPADDEEEFAKQVLLALDGQLGPEGDDALRAGLAADPEKRRLFVRICLQTQTLLETFGSHRQDQISALTDHEPHAPRPGGRRRRPWLPWLITAAACLLAALASGTALWTNLWRVRPAAQPIPVAGSQQGAPAKPARHVGAPFDGVALVIKLDGAHWQPVDGRPPTLGEVLGPRRLRLDSGRAVLAFLSGVTLILEGPADVDLVAIDRLFCRQGKLRARVPGGAEGFVIASPASAVVDRGTEFALNVDADGRSRVLVFEGIAEAALLDAEGSPRLTQIVERSKAFELDPQAGRIAEADARPDGFVRAPDLDTPALALDPSYAEAVLRSRPSSYWRFESVAGGGVPNEVADGPRLLLNGAVAVAGGSGGNGCAIFQAGEPEQFLSTESLWELTRAPGHAVELWFLSEGFRYASLVGFFPPKDYLPPGRRGRHVHTFLVELTAHDRGSLFKPASIRFLHRWPLDTRIGNNLVSEGLYIPRRWQHIVAQKNGDRLELFLDGEPDRTMPLKPDHPTTACRLVVGRRTPDPLETEDQRPFIGRIDELAIYDHPLTVEEVRSHYRLATTKDPRE